MRTENKQNELDKIEKHVLITVFGSETIPEPTAIVLKMFNINPNYYISKFETMLSPLMNEDGSLDGNTLKKILRLSKYNDIAKFFSIPDNNFYLSDFINQIIRNFFPGVEA